MYLIKLKSGFFRFKTDIKSDDNKYVFYAIHNGIKIVTRYTSQSFVDLPLDIFNSKKVTLQCYYILDGKKVKEQIDNFVYKDIKYTRGYLTYDFKKITESGYKSFDGKISMDISDINWNYTKDNNFNFNVHSLRFLSAFWGEYNSTYNYDYILQALKIFKSYWKAVREKKLNKFIKYDMSLGLRALHIYFLSNFKDFFSKEDLDFYTEIYNFHFDELRKNTPITLNNHGIWQIYGLRMLIYSNDIEDAGDIEYCNNELAKLLDFSFNDENIHVENSPFYHDYVVTLVSTLPVQLFVGINKLSNIIKSKDMVVSWLCDNEGYYYQIGDSHGKFTKNLDEYKSKLKKDMIVNDQEFYSKSFINSGYFVARNFSKNNFSAFILNCTSDTLVHKHADNLSFILWNNGIELITDSGPFAYEYSPRRDYFVSDKAHNVLSLEDRVFSIKDIVLEDSKILSIDTKDHHYNVIGVSSYNDFSFKRNIEYYPLSKVVIKDTVLKNTNNLNVTFNLTFGLEVELFEFNGSIFLKNENNDIAKIISKTPFLDIRIYKGSTKPLRGWVSKKYNTMEASYALEITYDPSISDMEVEIIFI